MGQPKRIIAIGCTEFSGMKHHVRVIGPAGMEQPLSSYALVDFCTMNMLTHAIGPKMSKDAKNTVSKIAEEK